ncbi:MAG: ABC transporter substrate-binding protein [Cellulosilyticaceae bacterium]
MKKFSKVLAIGLSMTMLGTVLVGCGGSDKGPQPVKETETTTQQESGKTSEAEAAPVVEPVTLRTVSSFGGTDPSAPMYEAAIKSFQEANPHVTVEDQSAVADEPWKSMVQTDFAAGNEPDVIFYFTDVNSKTIVEQGKVVSIDEIRKVYPDYASNIYPAAIKGAAYTDGVTYGVPVRGYYEGIYCNKDLFEANGLDLPTDWGKLETAVKTFASKGITPIAAALGHIPHYWIEHFILAEGGVKDHSNRNITEVRDTWVNGLTHFKEFGDMGAFPVDTAVAQHDIVTQTFADKKAAMFIDGSWALDKFDPETTTIMPIPDAGKGKKDPTEIIAGFSQGFFITKKAWDDPAKRDAAVKFVEHMTTTPMVKEFVVTAGGAAPAADIGPIKGLSPLSLQGTAMAGAAKSSDVAIDAWLAKPAWDYLTSKVPGIAAGKDDPAKVVDEVIKLNQ